MKKKLSKSSRPVKAEQLMQETLEFVKRKITNTKKDINHFSGKLIEIRGKKSFGKTEHSRILNAVGSAHKKDAEKLLHVLERVQEHLSYDK